MKEMFETLKMLGASLLVVIISYLTGKYLGFTSFSFAWVLNFSLMAWYTFINSIYNFPLNSSYFKVRNWEEKTSLYTYLGVRIYKKLLVWTGWENITRKENPIKKDANTLQSLAYNSRSSEFGQSVIAVIVLIITIGVSRSLADAKWLLLTNLLLNIYPVMLQRYNRPRYERLIKYFQ